MKLKLKQINLLKKSNSEDALRLSLQNSANPTSFTSDNLYEFILEKTNTDGIMNTKLMAVALSHSNGVLSDVLQRFIALKMICMGQPSVTFKADVYVYLYIDPPSSGKHTYTLSMIHNIMDPSFQEISHYEYGNVMTGHIEYLVDRSFNSFYAQRSFCIKDLSENIKENAQHVHGNFAWNIPISPQEKLIECYLDKKQPFFALDENAIENTEKYSNSVDRLVAFISGLVSPSFSEKNVSDNLYFIEKIAGYRVFDQSSLISEESIQIGKALWGHIDKFIKKSGKDVSTCFIYPLTNSKGMIGNNQYGQLESAGLYTIEQDGATLAFNLAQTLVRSTYALASTQGKAKHIPYCMSGLASLDPIGQPMETNNIFWKSLAHILTLHEEYRSERGSISTAEAISNGSLTVNQGNDSSTKDESTILDGNGNSVITNNEEVANHVNSPLLYNMNPVRESDEFKEMEKRLNKLDYCLKEMDGSYYAIPKSFAIIIPYRDLDNGISIDGATTYHSICETFQLDKAKFCSANGFNFLKYNPEQRVYIGQVLKIPTDRTEYLKVSDASLMALSSPTFKIPNSNYVPAESTLETYETLTIDDRDTLDGIIRHEDSSVQDVNGITYSPFGNHMLRIGDCTIPISPLSISVTKTSQSERVSTLRTRNSLQTKSGYSVETLSISLYFNGTDQINGVGYQPYEDDEELIYYRNGLRPLIAQFMKAPFLPIENELINHTYGIYSVCLQEIQLHSIPEFPHCIEVSLTLLPFDHSAYMFNEEFFEGAFCWPLFRWYYQQKMIKEGPTQLKPYIGNDIKLFTHKVDFAGNTEDILFNPANTLVFSIPQEGALKTRKKAIYELYQKKPPALFEEESQKMWIGDESTDGYKLYAAYQQYKNFTIVKNYFPKEDYPSLYSEERLTLATYGKKIYEFDLTNKLLAKMDPQTKYEIVEALAVFLSIYTNTYQFAQHHYFIINGFNPWHLRAAFLILNQNLDGLVYTGNEATEWTSVEGFDALRYKNSIDTVKSMKVVYGSKTDTITAQDFGEGVSAGLSIGGLAATILGIVLIANPALATGWGIFSLLTGGVALFAGAAGAHQSDEELKRDIFAPLEFKGLGNLFEQMHFGEIHWDSAGSTVAASTLTDESPHGSSFMKISKLEVVQSLIDEGWAVLNTAWGPTTYEIVPSAIPTIENQLSVGTTSDQAAAYKEQMEELRYLAHKTEEDIPTKTVTLTDIVVQTCTASLSNRFAPLQTQKLETPTYQFLGGSDITMRLGFVTKSRVALNELYQTIKESQYLAREYRIAIVNGVLDFHHSFFDLFGAKSALIENIAIETSDESAETFNVVMDIVSFDKTQKRRETLNKEGFGMMFDNENDWRIYQKLKRSNSEFEYSNVDLMLKEAELYPDLELPTYQEVNEFLVKHPIKDSFDSVFNYYPNVTNCKYVDPDFYLRCEETVRDFIESKLNQGNGVGMILHDKYNNAILSTCPARDEQLSVKNEGSEVEHIDDKTGQAINTKQSGPGFYENGICAESIKKSMDAMVSASVIGAGSELSATAYYRASSEITAHNQTPGEKQEAAQIMKEYRSVIDALININPGDQIKSFQKPDGTTVNVEPKRKILTLDFSKIKFFLDRFKKEGGKEYKDQIKQIQNSSLKIAIFDEGDILENVRFHSEAKNFHVNTKINIYFNALTDHGEGLRLKTRSNESLKCGSNHKGEPSLVVTLITLYLFLWFMDQNKINMLLDQSAMGDFYFIIDKDFQSTLQDAIDKTLIEKSSKWKIDQELDSPKNWGDSKLTAIDLLWVSCEIAFENSASDVISSLKDTYCMMKKFEQVGIFFYQKGHEDNHAAAGYTLLKNTMEQFKNVSDPGVEKTVMLEGADPSAGSGIGEDSAEKRVAEFRKAVEDRGIPITDTYTGAEVLQISSEDSTNPRDPNRIISHQGTILMDVDVRDCLNYQRDLEFPFRYALSFHFAGVASILTQNFPTILVIDRSNQDISRRDSQTIMENIIMYATLLFYGSLLLFNLRIYGEKPIPDDLADKLTNANGGHGSPIWNAFIDINPSETTWEQLSVYNEKAQVIITNCECIEWGRDEVSLTWNDVPYHGEDATHKMVRLILDAMETLEDAGLMWYTSTRLSDITGSEGRIKNLLTSINTVNQRLNSNLNVMHQQHLFRTSFNDLIKYDCRGRLVRAFPSYHMTIIDEGDQGLFYSMWDNFYEYNSIVSIDVYKDRRIVADTAVVQMTNIYHNLSSKDTDFLYDDYDYTFFDAIKFGATEESRAYWTKQWNLWFNLPDATLMKAQQEKVSSIVLSPGARVHLRMGYGSDAYNLPVLFNGVITEIGTDEIVTICAQGDGVELTNKLQVGTGDTTDPGAFESPLEPRMIIGDMFTSRGSFFKNVVNKVSNNWLYQSNPLGIAHFGQNEEVSSRVAWESTPIFFGWWSRITNHETETNNYGPSLMNVYAGGAARSLSKWAYTDLSQRNEYFSGDRFAWKWNVINWFTQSQEVNEIPTARIYLFDMTVNDVCQMLAACCPDYICAVAPFELRSTLFFGRPSWGYAKEYANMYKWDGQLKQLVKERAGYSRQSFSQTRFYNSYTDIISNKITATSEYMKTNIVGIYNEKNGAKQTAVVQIDSDLDDDCQTTGTVHLPLKADLPGWNYWHQGKFAEMSAISELKNQASNMYQGELTVLGDPSVKPHDKMYIQDSYVDMHGMVGVRAVHHELSMETGLISSITPDLLSIHDDSEGLEGIMWISQVASEVAGIVASLALTKISWRVFLNGPVAERIKQLGIASVNHVVHSMMGRYTEDGLLQGLISLDNSDDLLKALNTSDEALAMTNMQAYADNLVGYVDDRWKVTQVLAKYGDDLNFADPEVAKYITRSLDKAEVKTLLKTDGIYDMSAVARMAMSEDEIVQLHTIARVGSSKADDTLKAGFKSLSKLSADIDQFGSGKFLSKGLKNKSSVILKDKQIDSLKKIVSELGGNADKGLADIVDAAVNGKAVDGTELMNLLKAGRTRAASNFLGDTTIDIAKAAGKGTQHGDDLVKMCQKFGGDWHAGVAVKFGDNAADAVKNSRRSWKVGQKVKILFGKADDAADLAKIVNKADDVKDVIKFGTSLAGSLRTSMHAIGTAVAPGIGTALTIAAEIAFEILTEMAFEFYFRWKRRRQALILSPLIYRGHSFIAGLDGHQGAVLGDQPGVIDSMLMGQGFCSGVFNFLNCITGSDIDYGNQTLSQAYDDWKTQVDAWDADFSVSELDGLGIEELEQPN